MGSRARIVPAWQRLSYTSVMADPNPSREPKLVRTEGEWKIWEYRGATVRSRGVHNKLLMEAHPLHGTSVRHRDTWFRLIDYWLDRVAVP